MATESDLRDLLRGPDPKGRGDIDLEAVLSRARHRRRPRVLAAQALGSVALVGVLGTVAVVALPFADRGVLTTAEDAGAGADGGEEESATAPFADDDAQKWMPDSCGAPVTDHVGAPGLTLELSVETIVEPEERIPLTVTLRNDGPDRIVGTSSVSPYVSFARDGIVVWHSYATQDAVARVVDLAPGESTTFEAYFDGVICRTEDDLIMDDPRNDLPPAPPGAYELRVALVVALDSGGSSIAASTPLPIQISG